MTESLAVSTWASAGAKLESTRAAQACDYAKLADLLLWYTANKGALHDSDSGNVTLSPATARTYRTQTRKWADFCRDGPGSVLAADSTLLREYAEGLLNSGLRITSVRLAVTVACRLRDALADRGVNVAELSRPRLVDHVAADQKRSCGQANRGVSQVSAAVERGLHANLDANTAILVGLTGQCGLRIAEAVTARADCHDPDAGTLVVLGKGRKSRTIGIPDPLNRLIATHRGAVYLVEGRRTGQKLTTRHAHRIITRWQRDVGWSGSPGAHALRHLAGTVWYRKTKDLAFVQAMLGHNSKETTMRYVNATSVADLVAKMRGG